TRVATPPCRPSRLPRARLRPASRQRCRRLNPRSPEFRPPAARRRLLGALAALALGLSAAFASAAGHPAPGFVGGAKPDQAEGAKILGSFRQANIAGQYWLSFELRVMPRHGDERSLKGGLFGRTGPAGPETRLQLENQRWLIVGGDAPAAWISE